MGSELVLNEVKGQALKLGTTSPGFIA